jgi:hypothetical protein
MGSYPIVVAVIAGIGAYIFKAWLLPRSNPRDSGKIFLDSTYLLVGALALVLLTVLPQSTVQGWSLSQVATINVPDEKIRITLLVIYVLAVAGTIGIVHAIVAKLLVRRREN